MKISIILPCYNVEQYIAQCLQSIYAQDIPESEYEVICVNDCSPDGTRGIILEFQQKHENLILIDHKTNTMQGGARNTGLRAARGKYVWFIDSDDYIQPNCIGRLLKILDENELDILMFDYEKINETGTLSEKTNLNLTSEIFQGKVFMDDYDWGRYTVFVWAKIIRKSLLAENQITFHENFHNEDHPFGIQVFTIAKRVLYLPEMIYSYRQHPASDVALRLQLDGQVKASWLKVAVEFYKISLATKDRSLKKWTLERVPWYANHVTFNTLLNMPLRQQNEFFQKLKLIDDLTLIYPFINAKTRFALNFKYTMAVLHGLLPVLPLELIRKIRTFLTLFLKKTKHSCKKLIRRFDGRIKSVKLEACSLCQLNCTQCYMRLDNYGAMGRGYLKHADFKKFIATNNYVKNIELSDNGEVFLNPDLLEIIKYADEKGVMLTAGNGVNFNTISDEMIESLVKYKFRYITVSLDGASQETYSHYRRNGNFDRVIENIKKLNRYKQQYNSIFPLLKWQYVVMDANEEDVPKAKEMAAALDMEIYFVLTWEKGYVPKNREMLERETGIHLNRKEFRTRARKLICGDLWHTPQINWDGRLLGCCANYRADFGVNVFEVGLKKALKNHRYSIAKRLVQGKKCVIKEADKKHIPCFVCDVYQEMIDENDFYIKDTE